MILEKIKNNPEISEQLASIPFEFDVEDPDKDTSWFEFASKDQIKVVAQDYCGGIFIAVGSGDISQNPIFLISSEAKVYRMGNNLSETLEHILTFIEWRDYTKKDFNVTKEKYEKSLKRITKEYPKWLELSEKISRELNLSLSRNHLKRFHDSLEKGITEKILINGETALDAFW